MITNLVLGTLVLVPSLLFTYTGNNQVLYTFLSFKVGDNHNILDVTNRETLKVTYLSQFVVNKDR